MAKYYIGWDVGGWNCQNNARSRDALVILDQRRHLVGTPWRGNLRETINTATDTSDWINRLFQLCNSQNWSNDPSKVKVLIAIDAALGFSNPFVNLLQGVSAAGPESSETNPYLFRQTEQFLFKHGLKPLSAIKDMIGSQATKAIHVLSRFAGHRSSCGVWTGADVLTAIEAYPSASASSQTIGELMAQYAMHETTGTPKPNYGPEFDHQDKVDALVCALTAWLFENRPETIAQPESSIPESEGWIFVPVDGLRTKN